MRNVLEPGYEGRRISALRSYNILDSLTEEEYENITFMASVICDVPIAVISFIDEDRQWFKSHLGLHNSETAREYSFCAHAISSPQEFLIVPDSRKDERFHSNPLVTGDPNIVFYAGVPLINQNGYGLGTVCVIDRKPRELTENQLKALKILSAEVIKLLETRKGNMELEQVKRQLENKNKDLELSKRKLEQSERELRTMSEGTDVLLMMTDAEGEPSFFTLAWTELTGRSIDELMLDGWTDIIHEDDKENYRKVIADAFYHRIPYSIEFRIRCKSGNYCWLFQQGSPKISDEDIFEGFISSSVNISDQKNAESDLNATNRRLELALEAGKLGTFEIQLKSGNIKTSFRYNQNFGLTPIAKFTFSALLSMIVPEDRLAMQQAFVEAVKNNTVYEAEYRIKKPDGEIAWIQESGVPMYTETGEAIKMSGVSANITEQKAFTSDLQKKVLDRLDN